MLGGGAIQSTVQGPGSICSGQRQSAQAFHKPDTHPVRQAVVVQGNATVTVHDIHIN